MFFQNLPETGCTNVWCLFSTLIFAHTTVVPFWTGIHSILVVSSSGSVQVSSNFENSVAHCSTIDTVEVTSVNHQQLSLEVAASITNTSLGSRSVVRPVGGSSRHTPAFSKPKILGLSPLAPPPLAPLFSNCISKIRFAVSSDDSGAVSGEKWYHNDSDVVALIVILLLLFCNVGWSVGLMLAFSV